MNIGNGVTVTQIPGSLTQAGALIFKGGDFAAVADFFKSLTGYTGNLSQILINSSKIPTGISVYKIKTDIGYFSLRNVQKSIGDWTIDLPTKLSNGISEIKFEFSKGSP